MEVRDSQKTNHSTSHLSTSLSESLLTIKTRKARASVYNFPFVINITSRSISSTITTSLGGRAMFSRALHEKHGNIALRRAAGGHPPLRAALISTKTSIGIVRRQQPHMQVCIYCACSSTTDSTAKKKLNMRERGRRGDCDRREDNCVD